MKRDNAAFRAGARFFVFLFFFICSMDYLVGSESGSNYRLNKEFIRQFGRDIKEVVRSPAQWKGKDLLTFSAVLGTGALMFCYDSHIQDWVRENKTGDSEDAAEALTQLGNGAFLGALVVSSYLFGEIFKKKKLRKVGLLGVESFVITAAFTYLLKFTVGRARPYAGESSQSFHSFALSSRYYSFPSGHASSAFSVATVIAEHSKSLFVDVLVYTLAGLVAVTRVHLDKHYLSDVFIGSAIGYFVGKKISRLHRDGHTESLRIGFSLTPRYQALRLSFTF